MILSRRVRLHNDQLDEIHEAIVIRSVDPGTPKEAVQAVDKMGGYGQRITSERYQTLDVAVTYAINLPKRDLVARRHVFDAVNAWAMKKGWLEISEMPNRKVLIDHVEVPTSRDLWDWTAEFTITFRAYAIPFWQDDAETIQTRYSASSGYVLLNMGGTVDTVCNISFENISGATINNFRVWIEHDNETTSEIALTNFLPVLGGRATLSISHDANGLVRVVGGGHNLYSYMGGSDDLILRPGVNKVNFNSARAGHFSAYGWGRYV